MVQSSLVGHWPLHEWSGRANDLSGNGNHGTLNGGPTQGVAGVGGLTATSFDGADDYISQPRQLTTTAKTISVWVKKNSGSDTLAVMSSYDGTNGFRFRNINNTDRWQFNTFDGNGNVYGDNDISLSLNAGEWAHLVGVFTGDSYIFYHDASIESVVNDSTFTDVQQSPPIGASDDQGTISDHFNGSISDVRLYNRALSPQEVQHLYEIGSRDLATPPGADDANAVARYSFDDRSDTSTALDEWGDNDGTINGAVYDSDSIRDGYSMSFDGSNDRVELPNLNLGSSSSFTVSIWCKAGPIGGRVFARYDGTDDILQIIYTSENNGVKFNLGHTDGNALSADSLEATEGVWKHVTAVFDHTGPTAKIYVNGVEAGSDTGTVDDFATADGPWIGARNDNSQWFDGEIDDVRIYDRALSDYEIQQLYLWGTRGIDRRFEVMQQ